MFVDLGILSHLSIVLHSICTIFLGPFNCTFYVDMNVQLHDCMKAEKGDITREFAGVINVISKERFWSRQITLKMIASHLNVLLGLLNHKRRGLKSIL